MKSYYEQHVENVVKTVVQKSGDKTFPLHFHQNIEVFVLKSGEYEITVNDRTFKMTDGDVAIFDSYDVHSYKELKAGENCVVLIPFEEFHSLLEKRKGKSVKHPIISDQKLCDELLLLAKNFIQDRPLDVSTSATTLFLSLLYDKIEWTENKSGAEFMAIRSILSYIHENFKSNITRKKIAHSLGYNESYVSKVFNHYIKTGMPKYINRLRYDFIEKQKNSTDKSITDLIFLAGFGSTKTYYRYKKSLAKSEK